MRPPSTLLPGQVSVTQAQYEALALAHVKELWTNFGALTEVWLDGGCGAMCDAVGAALASCPGTANAVAFNGGGGVSPSPVRWCGTEGGAPAGWPTVWSTAACGWCPDGSGSGARPDAPNASWYPSGVGAWRQRVCGVRRRRRRGERPPCGACVAPPPAGGALPRSWEVGGGGAPCGSRLPHAPPPGPPTTLSTRPRRRVQT